MSIAPDTAEPVDEGIGYGSDRWWPRRLGGVFFLALFVLTIAGVVVVALGEWRWGTRLIGLALLVAAGTRALITPERAGMLAVRPKYVDVPVLIGLGATIVALSVSIPDQG
ncbi:MAG: DUF3017 domain-containing protein [Nocardioides sp.]|jgi:hypothetical protein